MTQQEKAAVTVIGLGPMGAALAGALIDGGHPVTVWNRTQAKAAPLVAKGASSAATPAEAVTASRYVLISVIDDAAGRAILDPAAEQLRGRILVNLTADTPGRAREMAAWAASHGIDYLDGAIMTPTETIGRPEASILVSGPEAVYKSATSVLASLGGTTTHVGTEPGRAAAFDVALLDSFWTAMSGLAHAFALAKAEGVKATELAPFAQGIVALASEITPEIAAAADSGVYPGDGSTLASNAASMEHILHAANAHGIDSRVMAAAKAVADRAIAAGHGKEGFARLVEVLARPQAN